jgi:hypothetical protein
MRKKLATYLLLCVPYTLMVRRFWFASDDAYISFRYARNLAEGHGLRFNLGETTPIEGYTNFLWTLLCSVFERLGAPVTIWPLLVSAACGYLLLWLVLDRLGTRLGVRPLPAALAALSLAVYPPFAVWSTGGLETMPFALLVFLTFDRLVLRDPPDGVGGGLAALALALIRFEGVAWAFLLLGLAAVARRGQRRPLIPAAVIFLAGYAAYTGWRMSYYDQLLPNTVHAKLGGADGFEGWLRGANYVSVNSLTFLVPLLVIPGTVLALSRKERGTALAVAAMAWAFPAYAVAAEGDFMAMGRFLVPGLAFQTILVAWVLEKVPGGPAPTTVAGLLVAVIGALPGWDVHAVPDSVREKLSFRRNRQGFLSEYDYWIHQRKNLFQWIEKGEALRRYVELRPFDNPHPAFVTVPLGGIGYYSRLELRDCVGLVSPEVFRPEFLRPVNEALPGHDWYAPPEFFAQFGAEILKAVVFETSHPAFILRSCEREEKELRGSADSPDLHEKYVIDFARVVEGEFAEKDKVLVTWRRIEGDPEEAWAGNRAMLDSLRTASAGPLGRGQLRE